MDRDYKNLCMYMYLGSSPKMQASTIMPCELKHLSLGALAIDMQKAKWVFCGHA